VNEFLLAKDVLFKRHIESIRHVLVECTVARRFWEMTRELTGVKLPKLHSQTWAGDIVDSSCCSEKDTAVILCGMWSLWMARNQRQHGDSGVPMRKAIEWARDTAYDLWQLLHPAKSEEVQRAWQHWQWPQPGWIKCNVDASFHAEDRRGATGVVLRNHDGRYIAGRAKWYDNCLNVLATEALACRDGVLLA
jgi:hypothetical protein